MCVPTYRYTSMQAHKYIHKHTCIQAYLPLYKCTNTQKLNNKKRILWKKNAQQNLSVLELKKGALAKVQLRHCLPAIFILVRATILPSLTVIIPNTVLLKSSMFSAIISTLVVFLLVICCSATSFCHL